MTFPVRSLRPGLQATAAGLQARLTGATRERDGQREQHTAELAALAARLRARLAAFLGQQGRLRAEVQGDVSAALAECLACYEAGLAALQQRLEREVAEAAGQQGELAARADRLRSGLQHLLGELQVAVPGLPPDACRLLLCDSPGNGVRPGAEQQDLQAAAQQVAAAVGRHLEEAEEAAIDSALAAMEAELQVQDSCDAMPAAPGDRRDSPALLLSPRKRQQKRAEAAAAAAAAAATVQRAPSLEANECRLAALLGRSRGLLERLAAGDALVAQLRGQVASLEQAVSGWQARFAQVCGGVARQRPAAARVTACLHRRSG